jgi:hypothetical protein
MPEKIAVAGKCVFHDDCHEMVCNLQTVVNQKMSQKIALWLFGGLAFFSVIVIGGAQWEISKAVQEISASVAVLAERTSNIQRSIDQHSAMDGDRHNRLYIRMRDLEHGAEDSR